MTDNITSALQYIANGYSIIPINPNTKKPTIKTWEEYQNRLPTEEEVHTWWKDNPRAGIAIVTGSLSKICTFDMDDDKAESRFLELVPEDLHYPMTETSRGLHAHFSYPDDIELPKKEFIEGLKWDFRGKGSYIIVPPTTNGNGKTYKFIPGHEIGAHTSLPSIPASLKEVLINSYSFSLYTRSDDKSKTNLPQTSSLSSNVINMFQDGRRDNDLFHVANVMVRGGANDEEIMQVLKTIAKSWGEDQADRWFHDKIKSARGRSTKRHANLTQEIREYAMSSFGIFLSSNVITDLQLSSREERKQASNILGRLCDENLLERVKGRHGAYRLIENKIETIDFLSAPTEHMDIIWPLGIHELVHMYPGNIGVIAGTSNAGKTSILINFTAKNMYKHRIRYLSSEMGDTELKIKLSQFKDIPLSEFSRVEWIERSSVWWDILDKDAINIIDFMEIHTEHFEIGGWIKQCFDKMRGGTGICLVAIQKKDNQHLGVGGIATMEKSRIYLSVDYGKVTITKAKNWAKKENPNGLCKTFEISHNEFYQTSEWMTEAELQSRKINAKPKNVKGIPALDEKDPF